MSMFYQIFIQIFYFLSEILPGSKKWNKRKHINNRIKLPDKSKNRIWIHCASAGEYEQSIPLIEEIKSSINADIIISFFSPSGMEYYKLNPRVHFAVYLPIDTRNHVNTFLNHIKPDYVIWIRYEFWPNFLNEISRRQIPNDLLFTDLKSIENKNFIEKNIILPQLKKFNHIYSVNNSDSINIQYQLINDGKWAKAIQNTLKEYNDEIIESFIQNHNTIILGSAHISDIEFLKNLLKSDRKSSNYKYLIIPHEINQKNIQKIKELLPESTLYSSFDSKKNILIVDSLGQLKYLYRYANIAWIGGGFAKSVHNILEAAAYHLPIISGPNIQKVYEAQILKEQGILTTFSNLNELESAISISLLQTKDIKKYSERIFNQYSMDNYTQSIIQNIKKTIERKEKNFS